MDKHTEVLLEIIEELFIDGVIGSKEWSVDRYDTCIVMKRHPDVKRGQYIKIQKDSEGDYLLVQAAIRYEITLRCYPTEEDLVTMFSRLFSDDHTNVGPTKAEKDRKGDDETIPA